MIKRILTKGSINWNFVDADLWLNNVITTENQVVAYEWFDGIATEMESV